MKYSTVPELLGHPVYINRYFPFTLRGSLNADGDGIRAGETKSSRSSGVDAITIVSSSAHFQNHFYENINVIIT